MFECACVWCGWNICLFLIYPVSFRITSILLFFVNSLEFQGVISQFAVFYELKHSAILRAGKLYLIALQGNEALGSPENDNKKALVKIFASAHFFVVVYFTELLFSHIIQVFRVMETHKFDATNENKRMCSPEYECGFFTKSFSTKNIIF